MKIPVEIKYTERYLPSRRHRKLRERDVNETVELTIKEMPKNDLKLAMKTTTYEILNGNFGLYDRNYFAYNGSLYIRAEKQYGANLLGNLTIDEFKRDHSLSWAWCKDREDTIDNLQWEMDKYILCDGEELYKRISEPRYVYQTFGLGHNHGGTSVFIENHYNSNIPATHYFNALEREKCIEKAINTAVSRGDTESIPEIKDCKLNIEVYMPEMVKCQPTLEHGKGDAFLNHLETVIEGSPDYLTAGLGVIAATANYHESQTVEMEEEKAESADEMEIEI